MYEINKLLHGKRFVRDFHTRWLCIRNLTRSISDTSPTRVKIPYARAFHEVISIYHITKLKETFLFGLQRVDLRNMAHIAIISLPHIRFLFIRMP